MQHPEGPDPVMFAAVLVVRDEAERLPACLASLRGVVDEVVVHDTGSVDGTVALARAAGAHVVEGYWDDDFSRARNIGLELARAPWVLVLDADEQISGDPLPDVTRLRHLLAESDHDVLTVAVRNVYPEELGGSYRHPGPRLLRREAVRYVGKVHEQPTSTRGGSIGVCPPEVLTLDHLGYADADVVRAKAARNAEIALAELDRLRSGPFPAPVILAKVLLDAGRSLVVCERLQEAIDALETVRALVPGTRLALEATDALARLLLGAGMDEAVIVLAEDLRAGGTDSRYCDWLRAQALAQLGGVEEALGLLRGVDLLRDPAGRELDLGQVSEIQALVARLAGSTEEAACCLAHTMARHGRIEGRGPMLLDFWGDRPPSELAALLRDAAVDAARIAQVATELRGCRAPGPEIAAAL